MSQGPVLSSQQFWRSRRFPLCLQLPHSLKNLLCSRERSSGPGFAEEPGPDRSQGGSVWVGSAKGLALLLPSGSTWIRRESVVKTGWEGSKIPAGICLLSAQPAPQGEKHILLCIATERLFMEV